MDALDPRNWTDSMLRDALCGFVPGVRDMSTAELVAAIPAAQDAFDEFFTRLLSIDPTLYGSPEFENERPVGVIEAKTRRSD